MTLNFMREHRAATSDRSGVKEAREAAKASLLAAGVQAPSGRVVVEGEVVSLKWHDNEWGGSLKMVVRSDEGWACWGSTPAAIRDHLDKGDRVRFSATLNPSTDDPLFAFSKRPSKAEILPPTTTRSAPA